MGWEKVVTMFRYVLFAALLQDYGSCYRNGTVVHSLYVYARRRLGDGSKGMQMDMQRISDVALIGGLKPGTSS
jgi:hypothetical protein